MSKIKLLITDFDGTLVDTFYANLAAYQDAFAECGYTLTEQQYKERFGLRFVEFMESMQIGDKFVRENIRQIKALVYPNYFYLLRVNRILLDYIRVFKISGGKIALASTARRKNLMNVLSYINAVDVFDLILTGEDVINGKPDPEIYYKAVKYFGLNSAEAIVFEDSKVGMKAAANAGISYIEINSSYYGD